jgi:GT2 family glycosyltransferase
MDLSIIIVNYNVKEFIQNLLHSIAKAAGNLTHEIIIVDNASDDGSIEFIKEKFPQIKLIENKKNLGFGKANNIGLSAAKGDYILLINPDTLVSEDTLQKMIKFFKENPEVGLAGCKILNPDGTLQLACRRSFPGPWTSFCKVTGLSALFPNSRLFARYNLTYLDENKSYEVDAISGSFMMLKRETYQKVGGFDEQFFMYGEDLDLCYRIQKAGYKVYYVHSTQIIHYKGESTKRSSLDETKIFYDAMHLFVKKHLSGSFLVGIILRFAIWFRKIFAFLGKRKLIVLAVVFDFIFFNLSLVAADRIYAHFGHWKGFPSYSYPIIFIIPALLHIFVAAAIGVYRKDYLKVLRNFAAIVISFFLLTSLTFFFKQYAYSRAAVIITYLVLFIALTFWRIILKMFFHVDVKGDEFYKRRTLVVGVNQTAVKIAKRLKDKYTDLHIINGLIGNNNKEVGKKIGEFEVIGSLENIKKIIADRRIDEVIFSSEELSYNQMMKVVSSCQNENVEFKLVGNNLDFIVGKASVSVLDDMPLIEIKYNISKPVLKFFKALLDYAAALLVLFLIYPFIYLKAKLVKKQSEFSEFILRIPLIFSSNYSLVGPKNTPGDKYNLYLGKKGLTGLWYVDSESEADHEKLDIYYARNQNMWLDLEIIGKTLNKMWGKRS